MTGYRVTTPVYKIRFGETSEYYGVEARLEGFNVGTYRNVITDDQRFDAFVAALLDWNLEDSDGDDIEASRDGLDSLPATLAITMTLQWWRKVTTPENRNRAASVGPVENGAAAPLEMEPVE
jgi:hypothetical protein